MNTPSYNFSPLPPPPLQAFLLVRLINHRDIYLPLPFITKQEAGFYVCICVSPHSVPLCFAFTERVATAGILWHVNNALKHLPLVFPDVLFDATSQIIIFLLSATDVRSFSRRHRLHPRSSSDSSGTGERNDKPRQKFGPQECYGVPHAHGGRSRVHRARLRR